MTEEKKDLLESIEIKQDDLAYLKKRYPLKDLFQSPRVHGISLACGLIFLQSISDDLNEIKELMKKEFEQK